MFHVKHGGMAELWGRQFEKYHFSPTRYRGVGVSRETWVRDVLGLGRCVYGKLGCFVLFGFMVMWWFHVKRRVGGCFFSASGLGLDGSFNGVFHVERGSLFGMICWDWLLWFFFWGGGGIALP